MKTDNAGFLIDKEIKNAVNNYNLIKPFDADCLSGCSYDIKVGRYVKSRNTGKSYDMEKCLSYWVQPGECVTLESSEDFDFSKYLCYTFIYNKHSVLAKGFFHPLTTIDPGFRGKLALTFFNLGGSSFELKYSDKIATICFSPLYSLPEKIYGKTQKPSYREGSLDIAHIVSNPSDVVSDEDLSSMYGKPLKTLYDRVFSIESKLGYADQIARTDATSELYKKIANVAFTILIALLSGWAGAYFSRNLDTEKQQKNDIGMYKEKQLPDPSQSDKSKVDVLKK